jgi:hypothetical protein
MVDLIQSIGAVPVASTVTDLDLLLRVGIVKGQVSRCLEGVYCVGESLERKHAAGQGADSHLDEFSSMAGKHLVRFQSL